MTFIRTPLILLISTISFGCSSDNIGAKIDFQLQPISCPSTYGGEPNLFVSNDGDIYLSWVEFLNDSTDALLFSKLEDEKWNPPKEVAHGSDWFVNWADFPSLVVNGDWMAAHWLQKSEEGTYDYDVRVATSSDAGLNWAPSFIPHTDGLAAEHGFVTLLPLDNGHIFATWLDGRSTKLEEHPQASGHEHAGGSMTLRCAEFNAKGELFAEAELDARVCDCCQTDAAMTSHGPIVVYRDRSKQEIRDISIVRRIKGQWSSPQVVHQDSWVIAGCPVNGPAISANGDQVAVAWFTAPEGEPSVNIAFSSDAGATFSPPIQIDGGTPSGRVDVEMLNDEEALVIWLEDAGDKADIKAVLVSEQGKLQDGVSLVETSSSRNSGFPILAKGNGHFILAWTTVEGDSTRVQTARLN